MSTATADKLEKLGAKCFARRPEGQKGFYETKFHGPDKVIFDITRPSVARQRAAGKWEVIRSRQSDAATTLRRRGNAWPGLAPR